MLRTITLVCNFCLVFLFIVLPQVVSAQFSENAAPAAATGPYSTKAVNTTNGKAVANPEVEPLQKQIVELERQLHDLTIWATAGAALLGLFSGIFGIIAVFSGRRREQATTQMIELMKAGEVAAQQRATEIHSVMFKEAQRTLELVNDTLTVASEASRVVSGARLKKVKGRLLQLEDDAKMFLMTFEGRDNRYIVGKPKHRERLHRIITSLNDFERYNSSLDEELPLPVHVRFIHAMENYLEQNFDGAIEELRIIAANATDDPDLRIRSWWWMGWEQNNLGNYADAVDCFAAAKNLATHQRERRLLIDANRIESITFQIGATRVQGDLALSASTQLDDIVDLRKTQDTPLPESTMVELMLLEANILQVVAFEYRESKEHEKAREHLKLAQAVWNGLIDRVTPPPHQAVRDYAFACLMLENDETDPEAKAKAGAAKAKLPEIGLKARNEVRDRLEPRNKVFANMIMLICFRESDAADAANRAQGTYSRNLQELSEVNRRVTIYSPLKKRNLSREEMMKEFDDIRANGLPRF